MGVINIGNRFRTHGYAVFMSERRNYYTGLGLNMQQVRSTSCLPFY